MLFLKVDGLSIKGCCGWCIGGWHNLDRVRSRDTHANRSMRSWSFLLLKPSNFWYAFYKAHALLQSPFKFNRIWKLISMNTLRSNTNPTIQQKKKCQPHYAIANLQPHILGTSMVIRQCVENRRISRRLPFFLERPKCSIM